MVFGGYSAQTDGRSTEAASVSADNTNQTVLDHFLNPRNVGDVKDADGVGEVGAAAFGDVVRISLRVRGDRIEDVRFKTYGCGTAIATSSMTTELIKGRTLEQALTFSGKEVLDAFGGLPPEKIHCPVLAEEAVKAALKNYFEKRPAPATS